MSGPFDHLFAEIGRTRVSRRVGRIARVNAGVVVVSGLSDVARIGDEVDFAGNARHRQGEVVGIGPEEISVLPEGSGAGLRIGDRVLLGRSPQIAPSDAWLGRIVDPSGRPLDGLPILQGPVARNLMAAPPPATDRRDYGAQLATGLCLFDTILPIVRGQRLGLFAGSGVGKSTLLAMLARGIEADVVVIGLVGERGREVREFVHRALGEDGMRRAIVVTATSDRSPLARRRCAFAAMAVAEHFRDEGHHVLLLLDSVTRLAEAHREVAITGGEPPVLGGFPASLVPAVTGLCERAGPGAEGMGDITALFTVLVAGSDMEGTVADTLRGVLDGHIVLDRAIAERGRFPAVDILRSVSRSLPGAVGAEENALIGRARALLGAYERSELMVRSGLYAPGSDPETDAALRVWPALDAFAARSSSGGVGESFSVLAECLEGSSVADA